MSQDAPARSPIAKNCATCGQDVSKLRRTKDQQGRYYCEQCVGGLASSQDNVRGGAATKSDDADLLFCEQCLRRYPGPQLHFDQAGRVVCSRCDADGASSGAEHDLLAKLGLYQFGAGEQLRWRCLMAGVVFQILIPIVALRFVLAGWPYVPMIAIAALSGIAGAALLNLGFALFAIQRGRSAAWCVLGYAGHLLFVFGSVATAYWGVCALSGNALGLVKLWPILLILPLQLFYRLPDRSLAPRPPAWRLQSLDWSLLALSMLLGIAVLIGGLSEGNWYPKFRLSRSPIAVAQANDVGDGRDSTPAPVSMGGSDRDEQPASRIGSRLDSPSHLDAANPAPPNTASTPIQADVSSSVSGAVNPPVVLTDADWHRWASEFENEANTDGLIAFARSADAEGMVQRAISGVRVSSELAEKLRVDAVQFVNRWAAVSAPLGKGKPCKLIWLHPSGNEATAMVRCLLQQGDVDYVRLILTRNKAGAPKIVDTLQMSTGGQWSELYRLSALPRIITGDEVALRDLNAVDRDVINYAALVNEIDQLAAEAHFDRIPTLIAKLPASLRSNRYISILNVNAAPESDDAAFKAAVQQHLQRYPRDPSLSYAMFERHVRAKDYANMLQDLFVIDDAVEGDAYIEALKAAAYLGIGNNSLAKQQAQHSLEKEPNIEKSHWVLCFVALNEQNFEEVARQLAALEGDLHQQIPDLTGEPGFAEFVASEPGKNWFKARTPTPQVPGPSVDAPPKAELAARRVLNLGAGVQMKLVLIRTGKFSMGSADYGGQPVHDVRISHPFYIGATEVTQAEWRAVMGNNPSRFKGDQRPVESINWDDAQDFCRRLSAKSGMSVRLPSSAEWEFCYRAGTATKFFFGDDDSKLEGYAWFANMGGGWTHNVGQKRCNTWGLYDMTGNVWEWCEDAWHADYKGAPEDGSAWIIGGALDRRIIRGGGWGDNFRRDLSAAYAPDAPREKRSEALGLRVVVEIAELSPPH